MRKTKNNVEAATTGGGTTGRVIVHHSVKEGALATASEKSDYTGNGGLLRNGGGAR